MNIETREMGGAQVLGLSGEIDLYTSPTLRKTMFGLLKKRPRQVVVDLSGVTYIDSSGIATFVEGLKAMREYNGTFKLASVNERIMDIIRFTKLDKVFSTYESINAALEG